MRRASPALGADAVTRLPAMGAAMVTVGMLVAIGPALRGLRIQPMAALREE